MNRIRALFHRNGGKPYLPPGGGLPVSPRGPLPQKHGLYGRGSALIQLGMGGFASGQHVLPDYHEPDRPERR